jgi:murein DD-endopeptidase MepM/ murein hydrolase activator NlpD
MKGLVISSVSSVLVASVFNPVGEGKSVLFPLDLKKVTSYFGERVHPITAKDDFHSGIDLAAPSGSSIRAVSDGVVIYAGSFGNYGNFISIRHKGGISTHYAHCQKILTKVGARVPTGRIIGTVGSSGRATGPHLHLEVRVLGVPTDPSSIIPGVQESKR